MSEKESNTFPFAAICGQDDLKLALILCAIDPQIGGVLALGEKGTGKTTAVRAIGEMLSHGDLRFPVVNLPIGATEDRVLGAVDLEKLINEKRESVRPGLLEQAHGGILYIDEVNLLDDYLTDILLDAASAGEYMLERDGISRKIKSRFRLVGTMNREEGELRPQLLDRFGLCVEVKSPSGAETRQTVARRRMEFDSSPGTLRAAFEKEQKKLRRKITDATENLNRVAIPDEIFEKSCAIAVESGAEGMRADILIVKSARALAAFEGRNKVSTDDADRTAPFVLRHRRSDAADGKKNSGNSGTENHTLTSGGTGNHKGENPVSNQQNEKVFPPEGSFSAMKPALRTPVSRRGSFYPEKITDSAGKGKRKTEKINIYESVRAYLKKGNFSPKPKTNGGRGKVSLIFIIDSSGSMASGKQISYAKKIIGKTAMENKGKITEFAAIAICGNGARIFYPPGNDPEKLTTRLAGIKTGGKTNMGAAVVLASKILRKTRRAKSSSSAIFIFTDGRINFCESGEDPFQDTVKKFKMAIGKTVKTTVVDTETGFVKIDAAVKFSEAIGADYARAGDIRRG